MLTLDQLFGDIRDKGAMNAIISSEEFDVDVLLAKLATVPSMEGLELSSKVSTSKPYFLGDEDAKYKVALIDFRNENEYCKVLNRTRSICESISNASL